MSARWIPVVAAALVGADGRWLMHRRPPGKHHAGLWEFPGGKVEPSEMPVDCLLRELQEELGIAARRHSCRPAGFAETPVNADESAIVLLLYIVSEWDGEPASLEGGELGWFMPEAVLALPKPPLDVELAAQLFQNR
jgi:8-oxo-dGTP diphosphatase